MGNSILLGAVAYDPKVVSIWEGIRAYFRDAGVDCDFALFSNYERQVEELLAGHIDIAWNTPLGHVRVQKRTGGRSQSLGMRDSDRDFHAKVIVRRDAQIRSLSDLAGKTIVLTRGTVHETAIPKLAERRKLPITFVFAADHNESFQALAAGKADAFANDDVQLFGMLAQTRSASDFRVVGDFLTYADYALTLRKDDPEFAEVVDRAFHKLAGSREIVAIYERWFLKPLPSGARLNLPMSPHLEEIFRVQGLPGD